jgi:hypothetical protein
VIEMDQVPKVITNVVRDWSNDGYIVSFKVTNVLSSSRLSDIDGTL